MSAAGEGNAAILDRLEELYPGRRSQLSTLCDLLAQPSQPYPPSILLHDSNSPRLTSQLLSSFLDEIIKKSTVAATDDTSSHQSLPPTFSVSVSPVTSTTPLTLFNRILQSLEQDDDGSNTSVISSSSAKMDGTLDSFLTRLKSLMSQREGKLIIAIQEADRVRDLWPEHIWVAFCSIGELVSCRGRITTIFVSTLAWSNFRNTSGTSISHSPLFIRFGRLGKDDILSVLSLDFSGLWTSYISTLHFSQCHTGSTPACGSRAWLRDSDTASQVSEAQLRKLHGTFNNIFYDSIKSNVRDVDEMRTLSAAVWHSFIVPLQCGEVSCHEIQPLLLNSSTLFRDVILRLSNRDIGPAEWAEEARIKSLEACKIRMEAARQSLMKEDVHDDPQVDTEALLDEEDWLAEDLERIKRRRVSSSTATRSLQPSLPLIPTFLLLSSFLASYNPARLDLRYFLRDSSLLSSSSGLGKVSKTGGRRLGAGRGRRSQNKGKGRGGWGADENGETENLNRQELLGPKPFTIDRLLAIFQALVTEAGPDVREKAALSLGVGRRVAPIQGWEGGGGQRRSEEEMWERRCKSVGVFAQINTLISRRMIVRTSVPDKLGTVNLRTNVPFSVISSLARSVGFDVEEWLWDWNGGMKGL